MQSVLAFHVFQYERQGHGYTYCGSANNTRALDQWISELGGMGLAVLLDEEKPDSQFIHQIGPSPDSVLLCPAAHTLVLQSGSLSMVKPGSVQLLQLSRDTRGPDRLYCWHPMGQEAFDNERTLDEQRIVPCSDPSKAFLYNVLADPELRDHLNSVHIYEWESFLHRYYFLRSDLATTAAKWVKASVDKWSKASLERKNSPNELGCMIINLATAIAPWQRKMVPTKDMRTSNALKAGGLNTVGAICQATPGQLVRLPNLGPRSLRLLANALVETRVTGDWIVDCAAG